MTFPYLSDAIRTLTGYNLPLPFPMFGLLVGLALWAAATCLERELRRLYAAGELGSVGSTSAPNSPERLAPGLPFHLVGEFAAIVFFAGIIGARIFHILEHADQLLKDPWSMLLTRSGFSILGGLMFGIIAGVIYTVRAGLPPRTMSDAVAPAMMLGYAIGRLGCQISGDGDWGIAADPALKPAWLPTWLWAQTYDGNIAGVLIPSPGVYPTPVYESAMALGGFFVLWALRKHPYRKGWLFAMYLVLTGSERMLIERIRVNPIFRIAGIHASQAEFISAAFVLVGIAALIVLGRSQSAVDVASKATPR